MKFALAFILVLGGCATHKRNVVPVPGCLDAQIYVPPGCYKQTLPNGDVKVSCPNSINTYHCKAKDTHAQR